MEKIVYLSMKRLPTKRKFLGQQMFMGYKFIENGKGKRMWNLKKATLEKIWNTMIFQIKVIFQ